MPDPAGLSTAAPATGHVEIGAARLLVASTEKLKPVMLVKLKTNLPPEEDGLVRTEWIGAGMLKGELVTPVNPLDANEIVALVIDVGANAVRSMNVLVPPTEFLVFVPPSVQVVCPADAVMLAVLFVTVLP